MSPRALNNNAWTTVHAALFSREAEGRAARECARNRAQTLSRIDDVARHICVGLLGLLAGFEARADAPITVEETAEVAEEANEAPPLLRFDPTLRVAIERLDQHTTRLVLSPDAELHVTGAWRSVDPHEEHADDVRARMWRASAGGSYDLGWARVGAHAHYEQVDNEFGRGRSVEVGVGITRTFRVSRTMTGFVSLSLGQQRWLGRPLSGEFDATQVMLRVGLRWR
jgi:hypothetical protein